MNLHPCPICKSAMRFHQDKDDCPDGCHVLHCVRCDLLFEFISTEEECRSETLEQARGMIAKRWNGLFATQPSAEPVGCECHHCLRVRSANEPDSFFAVSKMGLCPTCGNKRCPHASDHTLPCTNSNEPGQAGSIYAANPSPADEAVRRDAERWRYIRRKLCLTGNGNGTCAMQALNLPCAIPGWPEPGEVAEFCDAAIDAAIAQRGEVADE